MASKLPHHLPVALSGGAIPSPPKSPPPSTYNPPKHAPIPHAISIATPLLPAVPPNVQPTNAQNDAVAAFRDYQTLFASQRLETAEPVPLRLVDGALPLDFPAGTYYLTGPGLFSDDHGSTVHPLDGHGYLRAFAIDAAGTVRFTAKYVETEAAAEERDATTGAWRFTHRGPFSVLKGGRMVGNTKVMKNVANTSVVRWGGRLFCLWEGGDPYEIDPRTLGTVGKYDVGGRLEGMPPAKEGKRFPADFVDVAAQILKPILQGVFKMPQKRMLSHYKIDSKRKRLLIMSCNAEDMLIPRSHFTFYEFDDKFELVQTQEFNIDDHLMIHDWSFTDSHYILFGNRIKLDVVGSMAAVCGLSPMISALSLNPSKSTSPIYLLPRSHNNSRDWRVPIEAPSQMWLLHTANAFEHRNFGGEMHIRVHATACSYQWFNFQKMFGYDWRSDKLDPSIMNLARGQEKLLPHLVEVSISLNSNGDCNSCNINDINGWKKTSDFPTVNQKYSGKKNRYIYAATSSGSRSTLPHFPFDTILKIDTSNDLSHTWSVGRRKFVGEPIFIHKREGKEEDDGYLLVVEYAVAIQRCYLVILDAKMIGNRNGLVARFEVPRHLSFPLGFHGFWAPVENHVCCNNKSFNRILAVSQQDLVNAKKPCRV